MAYTFPTTGGLQFTHNGKTAGVFFTGSPGFGPILVIGEQVNGQWLGRDVIGPKFEQVWEDEFAAAGGNVAYFRALMARITAAVLAIFGTSAPAPPANFIERMNAMLASDFKLDASGFSER